MSANHDPEQARCRLETAEDRLLRLLEIAEAVTKACEARGIAAPGAVAEKRE